MENSANNKWSTIPNHIVINIAAYLPLLFQMELRLLNNHWKNSMNSLVFHSIENFNPDNLKFILKSYGAYAKTISISLVKSFDIITLKQLCPNISNIKSHLTELNMDRSLELIRNFNDLTNLEIYSHINFEKASSSNLTNLINTVNQHRTLSYLNFSFLFRLNYTLPVLQSLLNLKRLVIRCNYSDFDKFNEEYKKLEKLRCIKWVVSYNGLNSSSKERQKLVTPNALLVNNKLKSLSLRNRSYFDGENFTDNILSQELIKVFSNTLFNNLTNFEWKLFWSTNASPKYFFSRVLPKTRIWHNLCRLCIFSIDKYLIAYIIEHCPNLIELVSNSCLILPKCDDSLKLKSLKKLKRLKIGGFDAEVVNNESVIHHIFPSVETLNATLQLGSNSNDQIISDAYYVPLLFPKLKFCILSSHKCELINLINSYNDDLEWEELSIDITLINSHLFDLILNKLPRIKLVYLNLAYINNISHFKERGVRFFNASMPDGIDFSPNINYEL